MRRILFRATILAACTLLPIQAQTRGMKSSATFSGRSAVVVRPGFSSPRVSIRGSVAFGHNPRVRVFIGRRPFVHRRVFFGFPVLYPQLVTPLYYYGEPPYSYSAAAPYSTVAAEPPISYYSDEPGLATQIQRLRVEVEQLREEQELRDQQYSRERAGSGSGPVPPSAKRSPEAVPPATALVFRDGHRAEVQNYAIAGPTLWVLSDQRARKIPLSELDLDATAKANAERGIDFRLPLRGQPVTVPR